MRSSTSAISCAARARAAAAAACDAGAFEDGSQVLPVELVAFSATPDGDAIRLAWTTASETGNNGFDVQMDAGSGWYSAA